MIIVIVLLRYDLGELILLPLLLGAINLQALVSDAAGAVVGIGRTGRRSSRQPRSR